MMVIWAEPEEAARLRTLLVGAAAEAIHDAGMCDHQAQIVEVLEMFPALADLPLDDLRGAEAEIWRRVRE